MLSISVIMLTYNRERLISRAIESVLCQTHRDFEFIIVDNGSTDRSGEIADEYARKDNRIRVIHKERGNIGSGRNVGLNDAKGEYLVFIDDDDWCEPDFLEFLYKLARENDADVAICGTSCKEFDVKLIMNSEEALIELLWRKYYGMAFPTKLFKRELAQYIHFPDEDNYDDISQMHRLIAAAKRIAYHGLSKYTSYRHGGNNSAWTTNHSLLTAPTLIEYLGAYRTRTEWLCVSFPQKCDAWRYFEWSFMLSMVEKVERLRIEDCYELTEQMKHGLMANKDEFLNGGYALDFEREWMEKYII